MGSLKKKLILLVESLDSSGVEETYNYLKNYIEVKELSVLKEVHALEIAGYEVTSTIREEEWQSMLRRAKLSEELEDNKK
jgi:hypothetical protein